MSSPQFINGPLNLVLQICRVSVGGVWVYQGLVPKLLGPHPDEIFMANAFGIPPQLQSTSSYTAGVLEILFGICILLFPRQVFLHIASALATAALLLFVAIYVPAYLAAAFNPIALNSMSIALSIIAVIAVRATSSHES